MSKTDNLQRIQGIGPAVEKRLNQVGIHTYAQLAALQPEEIALDLDDMGVFSTSRIVKEDWVGQARTLQNPRRTEIDENTSSPVSGRHYAVFKVEFLVNDDNEVIRTLIQDLQDEKEIKLVGWDVEQLTNFFIEKAGLNITTSTQMPGEETPVPSKTIQLPAPQVDAIRAIEPSGPIVDGELQLRKLAFWAADSEISSPFIQSEQAFMLKLTLDMREIEISADQAFDYSAVVFAKPLDTGTRQTLGERGGHIQKSDFVDLEIPDLQLSPGAYHLDAFVKLTLPGATPTQMQNLMVMKESGVLHVY